MVVSRSQADLVLALGQVERAAQVPSGETRTIYGGLCHTFPVTVQRCGLAQALLFHDAKRADGGNRGAAHRMLMEDVGVMLGLNAAPGGGAETLVQQIVTAPTTDYLLYTRRILAVWTYFRRFAVSLLHVQPGGDE